ncbi:MAG: POTRA domain-containing protein [Arachidicoccus sp.]|nr:POTRA domain-containing protein [Arachidicoccus sp.]
MHKPSFFISVLLIFLICGKVKAQISTADTSGKQVLASSNEALQTVMDQANPQRYKVAGITVTGNKTFDTNLLLSVSSINVGSFITIPGGDELGNAIHRLWLQTYFSEITYYLVAIKGNEIYLELNVVERPKITRLYFKGISKSNADDLKGKSGIVLGHAFTDNMKLNAIDAIRKYYGEKGFKRVDIDVEEKIDSNYSNAVTVYFTIHKGTKVKINDVSFFGNDNLATGKLRRQMKDTKVMSRMTLYPPHDKFDTTGWGKPTNYPFKNYLEDHGYLSYSRTREVLSPYLHISPFSSSKFDQKKYEDDKRKVVTFYNSRGYRDAEILKDSVYYNSKGNINVALKVKEGDKYYFGNVTWIGNTIYSDSILNSVLDIQKGQVYNIDLLNSKLGLGAGAPQALSVKDLYLDNGYLFADVSPTETRVYNDTIDYVIHIQEGPIATVKKVDISGNDKTNEHVIRRALESHPGDVFSKSELMQSIAKLSMLKFFDEQKIAPTPIPNQADGTVDISWSLAEKSADQLQLSAGFGGGIGITGTLGVTFNNFSVKNIFNKKGWDPLPTGDGQTLSVNYQSSGRAYNSENIQFVEPWLGGKKQNGLSIGLNHSKFRNGYNYATGKWDKLADTSSFSTTGITIGYSKILRWPDPYFQLGFSINYTQYHLRNYQIAYQGGFENFRNGFSNDINLRITLGRNNLNSAQYPTTGSNISAFAQLTPPYSLMGYDEATSPDPAKKYKYIEYQKYRFTGDWYVPIGPPHGDDHKQFVFRVAVKMGFVGKYNSNPNVTLSPFQRFQLGDAGMSNTYSFLGYDIIAQRGYPVYDNPDPSKNPDQSGATDYFTIFNKYTMELRYPLTLSQSSTIFGLVFAEAANGWYSFHDYNPFQLRRSVGIGARFYLPMFGLLGFDYGIGLDRLHSGQGIGKAGRFTFMLGYEPD